MTDEAALVAANVREMDCPYFEDHTPDPPGYIKWHEWAAKMSKTHKQRKCSGCGLYAIWEPRAVRAHRENRNA